MINLTMTFLQLYSYLGELEYANSKVVIISIHDCNMLGNLALIMGRTL